MLHLYYFLFFFFNAPATTEIYTLSLHDALPISTHPGRPACRPARRGPWAPPYRRETTARSRTTPRARSEEHTSELQSHVNLVCRLLLEKKKKKQPSTQPTPATPPATMRRPIRKS